jgi:H+-translocating NAD(P) transhydrogenase subunit alpha
MTEATENPAELAAQLQALSEQVAQLTAQTQTVAHEQPFLITGLTVFVLACFVGYHVVWRVTPALHSPLMGITNAISSVIIVGAIMAIWPVNGEFSLMGFIAVLLASVNIFGGFIITQRMLSMFKKKD